MKKPFFGRTITIPGRKAIFFRQLTKRYASKAEGIIKYLNELSVVQLASSNKSCCSRCTEARGVQPDVISCCSRWRVEACSLT